MNLPLYCIKIEGMDEKFSMPWPAVGPQEAAETYFTHRLEIKDNLGNAFLCPTNSKEGWYVHVKIDEKVLTFQIHLKRSIVAIAKLQKETPA